MGTLSKNATISKRFYLPFENGSSLKGNNCFPFIVDSFSEGLGK